MPTAEDFHFVIIEKCLTDTPIDREQTNKDLIEIYHLLRVSQNHLSFMRTGIEPDEYGNKQITRIFIKNTKLFEDTVTRLKEFVNIIKLNPPDFDKEDQIACTTEEELRRELKELMECFKSFSL